MSPQFVDFDADGDLDIVAGIFDGSPHVAFGDGNGWKQPQQILDKNGERIVMNAFWNFDAKKWDETNRCDPVDAKAQEGHLTSAWATDLDGDGHLDLLLGDHKSGQVMARMNDGTSREPSFATRNVPVLAGGEPLIVPGTVTTLRLVDWNGDGTQDLLLGGMRGGVFVCDNRGTDAAPSFAAARTLIEAGQAGEKAPTRPNSGLYMDCGDVDGDGDLDLIVGAYSEWTPDAPVLDAGQQKRAEELRRELAALGDEMRAFSERMKAAVAGLDEASAEAKRAEILASSREELSERNARRAAVQDELDPLVPGPKRKSFTWLYENLARSVGSASEAGLRK